jgi:hypothetical protein
LDAKLKLALYEKNPKKECKQDDLFHDKSSAQWLKKDCLADDDHVHNVENALSEQEKERKASFLLP